jgi:hypothetical protein
MKLGPEVQTLGLLHGIMAWYLGIFLLLLAGGAKHAHA